MYCPLTQSKKSTPKLTKHKSQHYERGSKLSSQPRHAENKVAIGEVMSKTHNQWRRSTSKYLSGEEVCVMKKERVLNISTFASTQATF